LNFTKGKFDSENYAGVTLKPTAFPGNLGKGLNRYWSLTQNGISEFSFDAVFQYVPGDNNGKENELVCVEVEPDTVKSNTPANTTLHQITASGLNSFGTFTGIFNQKVDTQLPMEITEFKCFPNPFADQIIIEIPHPDNDELTVEIYNLSGQLVKTLHQGIHDGNLELKWNATNESGQKIVPGVYVVKVNGQSKQLIFESTQP
jgi:hypothetical protein